VKGQFMKKAKNHFSKVARPGRWQDKRPNGEEYRSVDFDLFLDPSCPADAITSAHWTVPEGLTIKYQWVEGARAYIVISGGTDGTDYLINCRITTAGGHTIDSSGLLFVKDR
jgi:hypothetical protein